jgi:hypothetical protein
VKFSFFHLMPYPYLPDDFDERYASSALTYPNANFSPELGSALYARYLDELEYADKLGFDGGGQRAPPVAYGLMPSPNLMAARCPAYLRARIGPRQRHRHRETRASGRGDRHARPDVGGRWTRVRAGHRLEFRALSSR